MFVHVVGGEKWWRALWIDEEKMAEVLGWRGRGDGGGSWCLCLMVAVGGAGVAAGGVEASRLLVKWKWLFSRIQDTWALSWINVSDLPSESLSGGWGWRWGVTIGRKGRVGRWWGGGGKLSIRVAVRGSRIRGIAPQVLTARMQNQSAKAAGEGQFSWIRATAAKHFG